MLWEGGEVRWHLKGRRFVMAEDVVAIRTAFAQRWRPFEAERTDPPVAARREGATLSRRGGVGVLAEAVRGNRQPRSEEHTSELQSLMRISYAVFCLKKKTKQTKRKTQRD